MIGAVLVLDRSDSAGQNTDVEMGPAGPAIMEPLELLVLDRSDPAGQHAVIQDTTRWLGHPLARPESSLRGGLVEKILDGSRRHVRFRLLPWTVDLWRGFLTWSIRGGGGGHWTVDPWRGLHIWNH